MEPVIITDNETKLRTENFRYFHILKNIEEQALRNYDLARIGINSRRVIETERDGPVKADKWYRAMKTFIDSELGRNLAWIVEARKRNLKERELLFRRSIDSHHQRPNF